MFFTNEDYKKIEAWLSTRTIKDTEFPEACSLNKVDKVPIVQDNLNKVTTMKELVDFIIDNKVDDFFNVTTYINAEGITLKEAILGVPSCHRKLGLTITFLSEKGNWLIYQFHGSNVNQWDSELYWKSIFESQLDEFKSLHADEEDITESEVKEGKTHIKFKNRIINSEEFIGMNKIILRRNISGTPACAIDDEDHLVNTLEQDMIGKPNSIYVIQYDFDVDPKSSLRVPDNCVLLFDGGSINNGTIDINNAALLNVYEYADMGSSLIIKGSPKIGQVLTFVRSDKRTIEWWDGIAWRIIADLRDIDALDLKLSSKIQEVINNHNADITSVRSSITAVNERVNSSNQAISNLDTKLGNTKQALETSISNLSKKTDDSVKAIDNSISELQDTTNNLSSQISAVDSRITETINTLSETVNNLISSYINSHKIGTTSITVGGTTYNESGNNINIPSITADKVKKSLTIKSAGGDIMGTFDGSSAVEVQLPAPTVVEEGKEAEPNKPLTINDSKGNLLVTYTGENEKIVNIPAPASITFKGFSSNDIVYNGKDDLTISAPVVDSSSSSSTNTNDIIGPIFCGQINMNGTTAYVAGSSYLAPGLTVTLSARSSNPTRTLTFTSDSTKVSQLQLYTSLSTVATMGNINSIIGSAANTKRGYTSNVVQSFISNNIVYLRSWYKDNDNNRDSSDDGLTQNAVGTKINYPIIINLVVYGKVTYK